MRHRVQQKRHGALARARRTEKLLKMKEDRKIRQEIVRAARGMTVGEMGTTSSSAAHPSHGSFITEGQSGVL